MRRGSTPGHGAALVGDEWLLNVGEVTVLFHTKTGKVLQHRFVTGARTTAVSQSEAVSETTDIEMVDSADLVLIEDARDPEQSILTQELGVPTQTLVPSTIIAEPPTRIGEPPTRIGVPPTRGGLPTLSDVPPAAVVELRATEARATVDIDSIPRGASAFLGGPDGQAPIRPVSFGRFVLAGRLSGTSDYDVYLAYDESGQSDDRPVALKILRNREDLIHSARVERFNAEAQAALTIRHPGLVTVYEHGEADDQPYLVREVVDGMNIRGLAALANGKVTLLRLIALQVAAVLSFLHTKRYARGPIVHGELSPAAIVIARDGTVKLTDAGLGALDETPLQADNGARRGLAGYAAPEQRGGQPLSDSVDIYALGRILLEYAPAEDQSLIDLGKRMTREDPSERPSIAAVAEELQLLVDDAPDSPISIKETIAGLLKKPLPADPAESPSAAIDRTHTPLRAPTVPSPTTRVVRRRVTDPPPSLPLFILQGVVITLGVIAAILVGWLTFGG